MAAWYDNVNLFIFFPHGRKEVDRVNLFEVSVQKGRIEVSDFRRLPPLNSDIDDPNPILMGNNNTWPLDGFRRLCRYTKPKNMAVNCQGICYMRVYPMDTSSTPLGADRFWVRVFDLVPLDCFGLAPKPLMPRQELYIELATGDPSNKVPGNSKDVISSLNTKVADSATVISGLNTKVADSETVISDLNTQVGNLRKERDDWKDKYDSKMPSESDIAFLNALYLSPDVAFINFMSIPYSRVLGTSGVSGTDYISQAAKDSAKGKTVKNFLYILRAYNEWRFVDLAGNEAIVPRVAVKVLRVDFVVMWRRA